MYLDADCSPLCTASDPSDPSGNVFSSDGSYLARFAASRKPATADQDAQQKLKEQEAALKR